MFIENQDELDRLDHTFGQIVALFVALFRWFASVFKRQALDISTPATVERKDTYSEKRKRVFLSTFEDADALTHEDLKALAFRESSTACAVTLYISSNAKYEVHSYLTSAFLQYL